MECRKFMDRFAGSTGWVSRRESMGWLARAADSCHPDSMPVTPQETAATLRQRSADSRRAAESRAADMRDRTVTLVRGQLPAGGRAWLIGSLAWGAFGVRSDVDIVLANVDGQTTTSIEVALCTALGLEVDLLTFESLPPSFRERVEREGLAIHGG
jgi:predicted nucleotidyltransferase